MLRAAILCAALASTSAFSAAPLLKAGSAVRSSGALSGEILRVTAVHKSANYRNVITDIASHGSKAFRLSIRAVNRDILAFSTSDSHVWFQA